jgi:hypothetical protein
MYPSRRQWAAACAAALVGASSSGWLPRLARGASASPAAKGKSCILLWMNGGPSQHHTFSPPEEGCEYKTIPTGVSGVHFTEYLPQLATKMGDLAVLRSMSTPENEHERARSLMHDGRRPIPGDPYPALGSVVSKELGAADSELPNFVTIDGGTDGGNGPGFYRPIAAFLGPRHEPLRIADPDRGIEHLKSAIPAETFAVGSALLASADKRFHSRLGERGAAKVHDAAMQQALALMHSDKAKAFDLEREPASQREAYGTSRFGRACLMARRLIEVGMPFVEVTLAGWDDHGGATKQVNRRCAYMDGAIAALLEDLKQRGLLDTTLVCWMGEFGRSPGKGDGHYCQAWTSVLAGCGLKTGQVIGRTDKKGSTVEDRPISAPDFLATLCRALGIDYTKEYVTSEDRPLRIVEHGEKIVEELFA